MTTKEQITQAALRLFLNEGYHATTMQQLVAATDVSKGAFYHYFDSKEALFLHAVETYLVAHYEQFAWEELAQEELAAAEARIADHYARLEEMIQAYSPRGMAAYFLLFFDAFKLSDVFRDTVQAYYSRLSRELATHYRNEAGIGAAEAMQTAIRFISRHEGRFFWSSIFPDA